MTFEEIEKSYNEVVGRIHSEFDNKCEARIRELVSRIPRLGIEEAVGTENMTYVSGQHFSVVYDRSKETRNRELEDLFDWVSWKSGGRATKPLWNPADLSEEEVATLMELYRLMDWWGDTTGGGTVDFPAEENTKS